MRITESRLRQIVREELATAYLFEADAAADPADPMTDPVARQFATALGNPANKRRDLEDEIKKSLLKVLDMMQGRREKFQYYITDADPRGSVDAYHTVVVDVLPGKSWFVLTAEDFQLTGLEKSIHDELRKLWQIKPGEVSSPNIDRLQSLRGQKYELTIDFPAEKQATELKVPLEYTVKQGDALFSIVQTYYGIPYSASRMPLYRLLSSKYMVPPRPDPSVIKPGDKINLPSELRFRDGTVKPRLNN